MAPNDLGAVIYTGSSQHSQDVTGDPSRLLAAIGVSEPFSTDSPGVRFRDEIQRDTIEADLWTGDDVPRIIPDLDLSGECMCGLCVLETITHIANTLESVPRRMKSLVFIGVDLNLETRQVQCTSKVRDARRDLFQALDTSGLIVHTINASGLETRLLSASLSVQGRDLTRPISPAPGSLSVVDRSTMKHLERQGNLAVLPNRTGGRFVVQTNDPQFLVGGILGESSSYYVLGFQPAGAPDGKTHQIRVKVNRGSVDVHTRRSYVRERSGAIRSQDRMEVGRRGRTAGVDGGGMPPRWRGDGRELYYVRADGMLMQVTVTTGNRYDADAPTALFQTGFPTVLNPYGPTTCRRPTANASS